MSLLKLKNFVKLVAEREFNKIGTGGEEEEFVASFEDGGGPKLRNTGNLLALRAAPADSHKELNSTNNLK